MTDEFESRYYCIDCEVDFFKWNTDLIEAEYAVHECGKLCHETDVPYAKLREAE